MFTSRKFVSIYVIGICIIQGTAGITPLFEGTVVQWVETEYRCGGVSLHSCKRAVSTVTLGLVRSSPGVCRSA